MNNDDALQFGYDLIRNDVLQDVLGSEHDHLLYWVGKSIARKQQVQNEEEVIDFFSRANWGQLTKVKEKQSEKHFELNGDWMGKRDKRVYQLEAGFLAETYELLTSVSTAVTYLQKKNSILFTIHFDRKDTLTINPTAIV